MQVLRERENWYRHAFENVFFCYAETKEVTGTLSCEGFYRRVFGEFSGTFGGTIMVTPSDFLADVELAAKAVMKDPQFSLIDAELADKQQIKIGKEFMRRRIYPLHKYMKPQAKR